MREDGSPPGLVKAFIRWAFWAIDAFPYVLPLLGPIVALTTQGHRRVGDLAAKTFVVRSSAAGAPIIVPGALGSAPVPVWNAPERNAPAPVGPQWDAARNTYIQWDEARRLWMQWDTAANAWSPIEGQ